MKLPESKIKILNYFWLPKQKQGGFALLEVLLSFLTITLFISLSLQAMVLASLVQIRARDKAEANLIIQQNWEAIKGAAKTYNPSEADFSDFIARCNGTGGTAKDEVEVEGEGEGMAAGLKTAIEANSDLDINDTFIPLDIQGELDAGKRSYPFTRTLTASATNKNVLSIRYNITDSLTGNTLAEFYTEIIPDASFQCP